MSISSSQAKGQEAGELGFEHARETKEIAELTAAERIERELKTLSKAVDNLCDRFHGANDTLRMFGHTDKSLNEEIPSDYNRIMSFAKVLYISIRNVLAMAVNELQSESRALAAEMNTANNLPKSKLVNLLRKVGFGRDVRVVDGEIKQLQDFGAKIGKIIGLLEAGEKYLLEKKFHEAWGQAADAAGDLNEVIPEIRRIRKLIKEDVAYTRKEEAIIRKMEKSLPGEKTWTERALGI